MDISVIAAVGSFAFSERVLKPKATVLVILGFVLVYDLLTKTQDVASLRVYRGPIMLVFTLMMAAYSLRKWRRNGIACDELIFLPGSQHGHQIGVEGPLIETVTIGDGSSDHTSSDHSRMHVQAFASSSSSPPPTSSLPDPPDRDDSLSSSRHSSSVEDHTVVEMISLPSGSRSNNVNGKLIRRNSLSSIGDDDDDDSSQDDDDEHWDEHDNGNDKKSLLGTTNNTNASLPTNNTSEGSHGGMESSSSSSDHDGSDPQQQAAAAAASSSRTHAHANTSGLRYRFSRWIENHPHLAQLWTFFFNRSAGLSNANATYAPSGPSVFGAALDLSMPVLFNFHVFIITFNHVQRPEYTGSELPLNMLPVGFLAVLYARTVIPPSRRARFWRTMRFAFTPPFHRVDVRDEFIGDCLTSWVRPGQDLLFGVCYFFVVIWGTLSGRYGLTGSGEILEESWWVHNAFFPLVAILPLWWKYLQTLRQAYDANQRWPYLGNAFKYLTAALVVIYGIRHPEDRRSSPIWIACFVTALVYQIVWDVVMDWELFEIQRERSVSIPMTALAASSSSSNETPSSPTFSSFRPESRMFLWMHMYLLQPMVDCCCRIRSHIPGWRNIRLRQRRLYKTKSFYWKILAFNILTRFTWMCSFLQPYHLVQQQQNNNNNEESTTSTATLVLLTSASEVKSYWGIFLPACEIVRRTVWGFLYLETKTIKIMDADIKYQQANTEEEETDQMTINSKFDESRSFANQLMPTWLGKQQQVAHNAATARAKKRKQLVRNLFVLELSVWGVVFVVLGGLAAM